jgi:hypothetical protein
LVAAEFEDRGITQWRSPDHLDLYPFANAEVVQASGDGIVSHDADDVYESALLNLIESLGVGHREIGFSGGRAGWVGAGMGSAARA